MEEEWSWSICGHHWWRKEMVRGMRVWIIIYHNKFQWPSKERARWLREKSMRVPSSPCVGLLVSDYKHHLVLIEGNWIWEPKAHNGSLGEIWTYVESTTWVVMMIRLERSDRSESGIPLAWWWSSAKRLLWFYLYIGRGKQGISNTSNFTVVRHC